jgi:hypothetical protein
MSIDFSSCTVEELWRLVAAHLEKRGIGVVLVGGAVASVYTEDAYLSGDLDFVKEDLFVRQEHVDEVMAEIGFQRKTRHYVHPECTQLFVEFVSGPVGIGEDTEIVPREVTQDGVTIKLLSPTDCVRDRLAGFIYHGGRDQMDQAVLVASAHPVEWATIEKWARGEAPGSEEAYAELRRRVKSAR